MREKTELVRVHVVVQTGRYVHKADVTEHFDEFMGLTVCGIRVSSYRGASRVDRSVSCSKCHDALLRQRLSRRVDDQGTTL